VIGPLASALGGIRVDRGTGSNEPLRAAEEALAAGDMVALMPQGTIPRGRAFFDPVLKGRWGAARLAQASGAPVIPVGIWGTEKVWPRSAKVPNITNVTSPPRVSVTVGAPVGLARTDLEADTVAIMGAISALLPLEAREKLLDAVLGSVARAAKKAVAKKPAAAGKAGKHVYFFGNGKADGNRTMKDTLGGKGSGLAEMTNAGLPVPPVLLSGHHAQIARWRREQSLALTAQRRPDLLEAARRAGRLSEQDEAFLRGLPGLGYTREF